MMEELLIDAGLTKLQSRAYLYLLKNGASFPGEITAKLKITRTNTYKVLDALEKVGLAGREEKDKKVIYTAEDPIALASLVAEKRNTVIALEKNVNNAMQQLRKNYARSQSDANVHAAYGKDAMIRAYEDQAATRQPLYFVASRADRPFMTFEDINRIRVLQGELSPARYGITPDAPEAPLNPEIDRRTKLTRTWVDEKDYTAPVEWSVSGESLVIQVFDGDGRTISIQDGAVAEAFQQIWQLLDRDLRADPAYASLPRKAKRAV